MKRSTVSSERHPRVRNQFHCDRESEDTVVCESSDIAVEASASNYLDSEARDIDELRALLPTLRSLKRQQCGDTHSSKVAEQAATSLHAKTSLVQHISLGVQRTPLDAASDDGSACDENAKTGPSGRDKDGASNQYVKLSPDAYSFLYFSAPFSKAFIFSIGTFCFQIVILVLILVDIIDLSNPVNPLHIPAGVPTVVRVSQFLAILIAIATQDDLITSINTMHHGYDPGVLADQEGVGGAKWQWVLSLTSRATEGGLCLAVTFILIMQSDEVTGMFIDFLAVTFVSTIDDNMFMLAREEYFSREIRREAAAMARVRVPKSNANPLFRPLLFLVVAAGMLAGWGAIAAKQMNGGYMSCQRCAVQLGDEFSAELSFFSSIYKLQDFDRSGRPIYVELGPGRGQLARSAQIAFCDRLSAWTFSIAESKGGPIDPCKHWNARTEETRAFDLMDVPPSVWMVEDRDVLVPFQQFSLRCLDCGNTDKVTCDANVGTCVENKCVCHPGRFGPFCEFEDPCEEIEMFSSSGDLSVEYTISPFFRALQFGNNGTNVMLYYRPVYFLEFEEGKYFLLFFTGRRWVESTSGSLLNNDTRRVTEEELANFLVDDFHAYWTNFRPRYVSAASDVLGPASTADPVGLPWYKSKTYNKGVDQNFPLSLSLLCTTCNNETNPCHNDGECSYSGSCECIGGTFGTLCQEASFTLCHSIDVHFGDSLVSYMTAFTGVYDLADYKISGKSVYVERTLGWSFFAYCKKEQAWTFTHFSLEAVTRTNGSDSTNMDPCSDWKVVSRETDTYDITGLASGWFIRRTANSNVGVPLEEFSLWCADCDDSNQWPCNGMGHCQDNRCVCSRENTTGKYCNLYEPCPKLELDVSDQIIFLGRRFAPQLELLSDENGTYTKHNDRPVYHSQFFGKMYVLLFSGQRWFGLTSEDQKFTEKSNLTQYFGHDFHSFYSNFSDWTVGIVSETETPGTTLGPSSPVGLTWYLSNPFDSRRPDLRKPLGIYFVCGYCSDLAYPCHNSGECDSRGKCTCPLGTFGPLCNVGPVCTTFQLFFSDELEEPLPSLRGTYDMLNYTFGNRPVYAHESGLGLAKFCFLEAFWVVVESDEDDPCTDWVVRSSKTYSYDALTVENMWIPDSNRNGTGDMALLPATFGFLCNG